MRKYIFLVLIIILIPVLLKAGEYYSYGSFKINSEIMLYGDNVNVRSKPGIEKSSIVDILPVGYKVKILEKTASTYTIYGLDEYWYKVKYSYKDKFKEGYIWGGLFSLTSVKIKNNYYILMGLRGMKKATGNFEAELRIIKDNKIVKSLFFDPVNLNEGNNKYGYSVSSSLKNNMGFKDFKGFLNIKFTYEACSYPNGEMWFAYNDKSIYKAVTAITLSEAGVFRVEDSLVFPALKGGKKNIIKIVRKSYGFDEKSEDYKLESEVVENIQWTGQVFKKLKK